MQKYDVVKHYTSTTDPVNAILLRQLQIISNPDISAEEFEIECRRCKVMNGIASNLVKIAALGLQANAQQQTMVRLNANLVEGGD